MKEERVKVTCVRCGTTYTIPKSQWEKWKENNISDTDHSAGGYICTAKCGGN